MIGHHTPSQYEVLALVMKMDRIRDAPRVMIIREKAGSMALIKIAINART